MFKKARKALVESFVGAIALGCVFAYGVFNLVDAVSVPFANWSSVLYTVSVIGPGAVRPPAARFPWVIVAMPVYRGVGLLVIGYLLLRWLYYPAKQPAITASGVSNEAPQGDESPTPNT
jgi:hypothetical protein